MMFVFLAIQVAASALAPQAPLMQVRARSRALWK